MDPGVDAQVPGAVAAASAIRSGRRTSEALVRGCLEAIEAREGTLRAWVHLDPDAALAQARARDAEPSRGPLHGVPVAVKDIIDTAEQPTEYGSPVYAGHQPSVDAACVARLRDAGAVILGKTVTTEFALFHPGPTTNPHDRSLTPGGSSSGSAAAVGADTISLALGTQTAGSVIRPASYCGVVGIKPTFGAVPTGGVKPIAPTLDTVGAFARDIDDAALVLGVLTGDSEIVRPGTPSALSVGFARSAQWEQIDPECRDRIEAAARALAEHVPVQHVELPAGFDDLVESQTIIMHVEAAQALAAERRDYEALLSERLRSVLEEGERRAAEYDQARAHRDRCDAQLDEVFAEVDVLLTPSVLGEAPPASEGTGDPLLCRAWTALGTPTVSVPALVGPAGMPLGMQVVARPGGDALALAAAAAVGPYLRPS